MNKQFNKKLFKKEEELEPDIAYSFLDWSKLLTWVDNRCKKYNILQKIDVGSTYEQREMFLLKLSTGGNKPAVFIMGGEQGRDWMSTAIVLNFINSLLENPNDIILTQFDFYFIPVFNPDGYEFSMSHDPFWNKNRKAFFPVKKCKEKIAVGVNIDRNWFLARARTMQNDECLSVYLGQKCLTEEETIALSLFLNSIANNLLAFINLRGFENLVTVPFADPDINANNQAILMEMLLFACGQVKHAYNVTYRFSNTASCLYNFSGNVADWVKSRLNVPIVYTMFMKQEPFVLPHVEHITTLANQFTFMTREMVILGGNIYGPLFNKQNSLYSNVCSVVLSIFIILLK